MAMNRRCYATIAIGVFILIAGYVWLMNGQPGVQPEVTLAFVTQATNGPPGQATFRVYNDGPRTIFLSWMIVEVRTPKGWRVVQKVEPKDPRVVASGKSMDLMVSVPAQAGRWKLRLVYGKENRGPALLLTRVELGIKNRSVSGLGSVGVFTGQDSVVTEVSQ